MEDNSTLQIKYQALKEYLQKKKKVTIAFSGGVDSTTLLEAALRERGVEVQALLVKNELVSFEEESFALDFLHERNISHRVVTLSLLTHPLVRDNPPDRCYHCKKEIFKALSAAAAEADFPHILEGSNADDLNDYRPGKKAIKELGVESPLEELGFTKKEIRELARYFDLPVADRPSSPCLATRFPAGASLTVEALRKIEKAEGSLKKLGLHDLRLRLHDKTARLEVAPGDISFCVEEKNRQKIINILKETGANYITLDLQGYRTGSMNTIEEE